MEVEAKADDTVPLNSFPFLSQGNCKKLLRSLSLLAVYCKQHLERKEAKQVGAVSVNPNLETERHYPDRIKLQPQMLLRKAIQKTKVFFNKTLQNFKSFLFGEYQKLPNARPLNPLYCGNSNLNMQQLDQFYKDFTEQWEPDNCKEMRSKKIVMSAKEPMKEEDDRSGSLMKLEEHSAMRDKHEEIEKEEKKVGSSHEGKRGEPCPQIANGGGYVLKQKLKELEMMDMNDVDQVLDIEEVLHYYSRLKCPVYLDIVDKFFVDMYSDFILPQPSVSITNSSRRLGPLKF